MKTAFLTLGIALAVLVTDVDAQMALRRAGRARSSTRQADYRQEKPVKVKAVDYGECEEGCENQYSYGGSECDDGCGDGCGSGCNGCGGDWSGGLLDGGGCAGCGGNSCGCVLGTSTSVAYPRCFPFKSPCVGNQCDPCCRTIFAEMWCDLQRWTAAAGPGAGCVGSCIQSPVGFRCGPGMGCTGSGGCGGFGGFSGCGGASGCGGGFSFAMPALPSFQGLLTPPCSGSCGVQKRGVFSGLAGILFGGCSSGCDVGGGCGSYDGCGGGCNSNGGGCESGNCGGCDSCGGGYGGGYGGYGGAGDWRGEQVVDRASQGTSHRYYATRNPLNDRTEYVTERRFAELRQIRADQEAALARRQEQEDLDRRRRQATAPRERSRSARRRGEPQANRSAGRNDVRAVSYEHSELKLNGPRGEKLDDQPPFLRFSDREFRTNKN